MLARRIVRLAKEVSASLAGLPETIEKLLLEIHQSLHDKALAFRRSNTRELRLMTT